MIKIKCRKTQILHLIFKIKCADEHTTTVHYYATCDTRLHSTTWKPPCQLPHTNQIVMKKPETINRDHVQWTGTIDTHPTGEGLINLANMGMTPTRKIGSRSRKILTTMNDLSHHILTHTWMRG